MKTYLIKNAQLINEGKLFHADVLIKSGRIERVDSQISVDFNCIEINAENKWLMPGIIDDQVHFREPGLTHKGEIYTEAKAGVAGGVTSYMEMPNTKPPAITQEALEEKYLRASKCSLANYSFFMGTSNENADDVLKTDPRNVCGIKIFMGSSTGNMLVDDEHVLSKIFRDAPCIIATHCEDEPTVQHNLQEALKKYGEDIPVKEHPLIRSREACLRSSELAFSLAKKYNTRLHILHISTAEETHLFGNDKPLSDKRITSEACSHHLWFSDEDYEGLGSWIKWNPAVKKASDREAIWKALLDDRIDILATDHAPHTKEEKMASGYKNIPSGGPLIQHALNMMLHHVQAGRISLERMVEKMCHAPAICFDVHERGFIREGYHADLVLIDPTKEWTVNASNILYKCGWSPLEGQAFKGAVSHTFVNGHAVYVNGAFDESVLGSRLQFDRN